MPVNLLADIFISHFFHHFHGDTFLSHPATLYYFHKYGHSTVVGVETISFILRVNGTTDNAYLMFSFSFPNTLQRNSKYLIEKYSGVAWCLTVNSDGAG